MYGYEGNQIKFKTCATSQVAPATDVASAAEATVTAATTVDTAIAANSAVAANPALAANSASGKSDIISSDMEKIESLLRTTYSSHYLETQVNAMCMHVISAGGKRMRPRLLMLAAKAIPSFNEERDAQNVYHIAAAIEMLHTATLVHDDVIDKATTRRGVTTLNDTSGNHPAVLAGDYLFTRCFHLLQYPRNFDVINAVNYTLSELVVGELFQLEHEGDLSLSREGYYHTIYAKTGVLFELASSVAAILIPEQQHLIPHLKEFGQQLGIAFQIKDDMLDYSANAAELGKDPGTDLQDQRITLPVLVALERSSGAAKEELSKSITEANLEGVRAAIADTNALELCQQEAEQAAAKAIAALDVLPDSPYRQALIALTHKAVARTH